MISRIVLNYTAEHNGVVDEVGEGYAGHAPVLAKVHTERKRRHRYDECVADHMDRGCDCPMQVVAVVQAKALQPRGGYYVRFDHYSTFYGRHGLRIARAVATAYAYGYGAAERVGERAVAAA